MKISGPSHTVLNYLFKRRGEKGHSYGSISHQTGLKTWEEAKEGCQVLYENGLAVWKEERVFITTAGRKWMEDFMEAQDDRIREYVYDDYDFALLRFLYELEQPLAVDDFPEILKDEAPNYTNGSAAYNLSHMLQIELRPYVESPNNKYQLKLAGRKYYEHQAKQKGVSTIKKGENNKPADQHFTESEKTEINARLDQVQEMMKSEFEKILTGQQFTYDDVMAELNELREYTGLPKKIWRQLKTGKLQEMVVSGVIGSTISQHIAGHINPVIDKLLE